MPKTLTLKIGGSLAVDDQALGELAICISSLVRKGFQVALVHGGGKDINENLSLLKEEPKFIQGLRVTDEKVLNMVEMTLSGYVNKKLVRLLLAQNCLALGISGVDGSLFYATKKISDVDLGRVGTIEKVNTKVVTTLWDAGYTPVISPISYGDDGKAFNVNADNAASDLAAAIQCDQLVFISDVPGVLQNNEVIPELNEEKVEKLISEGVISGGMIPKVRSSLDSIRRGIRSIHIVGWKGADELEKQISGELNYGTIIQ